MYVQTSTCPLCIYRQQPYCVYSPCPKCQLLQQYSRIDRTHTTHIQKPSFRCLKTYGKSGGHPISCVSENTQGRHNKEGVPRRGTCTPLLCGKDGRVPLPRVTSQTPGRPLLPINEKAEFWTPCKNTTFHIYFTTAPRTTKSCSQCSALSSTTTAYAFASALSSGFLALYSSFSLCSPWFCTAQKTFEIWGSPQPAPRLLPRTVTKGNNWV